MCYKQHFKKKKSYRESVLGEKELLQGITSVICYREDVMQKARGPVVLRTK